MKPTSLEATLESHRPCALPKCKGEATVAYDVRSSFSRLDAFQHHGGDQSKNEVRHYEVCDKHSVEFFGDRAGFLDVKQSERIEKKLVANG